MKKKNKKSGPLPEDVTRQKLLYTAKQMGCDIELRQLFDKYDKLLKNTKNEVERQQISILGNVEIHKLLGFRNALVVNGQEIIPADPDFEDKLDII